MISRSKFAWMMLFFSIAAVIYFTAAVIIGETGEFDQSGTAILSAIFPEQTRRFFIMITYLGSKEGIAVIGIALILWLWFKKKNFAGIMTVVIAVALGNELNNLIKNMIKRPRPELEHLVYVNSYSYPSGHAMVGIILYMTLAYFIFKELKTASAKWLAGILFGFLVLLIGVSRVVLQVHYPSDVFAGFAWGYVWVFVVLLVYERFFSGKKECRKNS
jgi:membrane-associated phospholipid phosphatase